MDQALQSTGPNHNSMYHVFSGRILKHIFDLSDILGLDMFWNLGGKNMMKNKKTTEVSFWKESFTQKSSEHQVVSDSLPFRGMFSTYSGRFLPIDL